MSFQLTPADVWEALGKCGLPEEADKLRKKMEAALQEGANMLAAALNVESGAARMDQQAFAGLLVPMLPAHKGQALPEVISHCDDEECWDED